MHIYARAAARGKRVQVNALLHSSTSLSLSLLEGLSVVVRPS